MAAQDFFRTYLPYARSVSEQTGIDPRLVLAQAALETGYGKSAPNYNFFGIKGRGQTQQTKEFRNGQWVTENAGFRSYSDPSGSFADYADLMMNSSRYEPVRAGRTLEEQIAAMASSGYATDPNYGAKLTKIASMIDYNSPELIGADAMRALGRDTGAIPVTQKRTEAPMGLLNMGQPSGQQAPAQAQGSGFWDNFAGGLLSDPDRRARLAMALEGMTLRPNEGVIAAAQSGIEDRKTQATLNKTIEWLRGQPNGEAYIRMIEAGASPAQVIQALMQAQAGANGEIKEVGGKLVRIMPDGTVQEVYGGGPDQEAIAAARKEFTSLQPVKDFSDVSFAYSRVIRSAEDPSPAGDLALIFNYMKILDPGSVVREGEFATAQNAGGVDTRVRSMYNSVINGERLTPEQRADFADRATRLYSGAQEQYGSLASQYSEFARQAGLPVEQVIPNFGYSGDLYAKPLVYQRPPTPAGVDDATWAATWQAMTDQERAAYLKEMQ